MANSLLVNLSSYWKCDESSGNLADSKGSVTLTNTNITFSAGLINNGANINGTGNYATGGTGDFNFVNNNAFSCSLWFKQTSSGGNQMMVSKGSNTWNIFASATSNKLTAAVPGVANVVQNSSAIPDANWHHAVLTHAAAASNEQWTLYQDSIQVSQANNGNSMSTNTLNFAFGAEAGSPNPTLSFGGSLDEVGIWTKVLTQTDVNNLYNSGSGLAFGSFDSGGGGGTVNPTAGFMSLLGIGN